MSTREVIVIVPAFFKLQAIGGCMNREWDSLSSPCETEMPPIDGLVSP